MAWTIHSDPLGLEDKVAVVTGGGGAGMAGQHCRQLARAGCHIVVANIDEDGGQATVKAVEEIGRKAIFVKADTRVRADVDDLLKATLGAFGRLDIAVNHVGGMGETGPTPFLDYADEAWDDVVGHNLKSTFLCCCAEALEMIRQGTEGRIINVASSSGVVGAESIAAYGASKACVIHLTKSLAQELARYGIRVNCLSPARTPTHGSRRCWTTRTFPRRARRSCASRARLLRWAASGTRGKRRDWPSSSPPTCRSTSPALRCLPTAV